LSSLETVIKNVNDLNQQLSNVAATINRAEITEIRDDLAKLQSEVAAVKRDLIASVAATETFKSSMVAELAGRER